MSLAGAVVWGVVPFAPEAPFRLYAGPGHEPVRVETARTVIESVRKGGDPQLTYLVPGKVRPVLVLSDAHDDDLGEVLALRLMRLAKLTAAQQQVVRGHQSPTLFHLVASRFPGLPEENAAMIAGLVRVHRSALDETVVCGRLNDYELTTVHERFVRFHGFDLRNLVREEIRRAAAARARKSP